MIDKLNKLHNNIYDNSSNNRTPEDKFINGVKEEDIECRKNIYL